MSKVSMMGKITCADGKGDELEAAFAAMTEASSEEAGCEIYSYHRGEGNEYWFFALMSNMEATQAHSQGDAMKAAMGPMMTLLASPPEMFMLTPLPAKGYEV